MNKYAYFYVIDMIHTHTQFQKCMMGVWDIWDIVQWKSLCGVYMALGLTPKFGGGKWYEL